ncbi:MAG: HAD family hydrolase [Arcobacteraceae bacterium]|jgi:phosphoglycolate phosphatase|nr:HAD family hydrolase [Arcobacteraceae bacterium]MDY0328357.1 HAD family hydrolase [Arcobacteraceae bacterium]
MKNLIIFDMDGTLVDSGDAITNTINHVRSHINMKPLEKNYLLENLNNPNINSAEFFYNTPAFTKKQTELFEKYYYQACVVDLKVYDGIIDLLEKLKQNNFKLSVATNAHTPFAIKMLTHLQIDSFFSTIIGADMVERSKPHPDMIIKTMTQLNNDPCQTILIGDSHKDSIAAKNANIDSILVNWGFSNHDTKGIDCTTNLLKEIYARYNIHQ